MPGLIRGVARTAVVAGTATAVSGNVARRQQGRWAEKEQQAQADAYAQQQYQQAQMAAQQQAAAPPPPAAPAAPQVDVVAELTKLADLKAAGILSDAEFEAAKAKILAG